MPITSFLNGVRFDRETTRVMGAAFEMTRAALGIAERRDDVNEIVAKTIVELAKQPVVHRPIQPAVVRPRLPKQLIERCAVDRSFRNQR